MDWVPRGAGDGLLSRGLSTGVPSALSGLTTVFGMGTGVALTLESPAKHENGNGGRPCGWESYILKSGAMLCLVRIL